MYITEKERGVSEGKIHVWNVSMSATGVHSGLDLAALAAIATGPYSE